MHSILSSRLPSTAHTRGGLLALGSMALALTLISDGLGQPPERERKVREDQSRMLKEGFWIYNDLAKGFERAGQTGKPVLVIFRCLPCEACAQLDASVIEDNPQVRKWLNQFIPVRIVHANGMDLHKFQFDYDQSWTAFVLHADGTIIGRYGTRSHETKSDDDVSLEGFLESLKIALELHQRFDEVRPRLLAKTGIPAPLDRPELFPELKEKYGSSLDYEGKVVASCIHCHQVGEALRAWHRADAASQNKPLSAEVIFPYPNPKVLGMVMDPKRARTLASVASGSSADAAGLKAGDELLSCQGQPLISTADIQWVLHHAGKAGTINIEARRNNQTVNVDLKLANGWRDADDIAWRVGSWQLRRQLTGGLKLDELSPDQLKSLKLGDQAIALRVKHVGQYAPHDRAKRAGFKVGDILISIGAWQSPMTESQLLVRRLREGQPGEVLPAKILRDDKELTLDFPAVE